MSAPLEIEWKVKKPSAILMVVVWGFMWLSMIIPGLMRLHTWTWFEYLAFPLIFYICSLFCLHAWSFYRNRIILRISDAGIYVRGVNLIPWSEISSLVHNADVLFVAVERNPRERFKLPSFWRSFCSIRVMERNGKYLISVPLLLLRTNMKAEQVKNDLQERYRNKTGKDLKLILFSDHLRKTRSV